MKDPKEARRLKQRHILKYENGKRKDERKIVKPQYNQQETITKKVRHPDVYAYSGDGSFFQGWYNENEPPYSSNCVYRILKKNKLGKNEKIASMIVTLDEDPSISRTHGNRRLFNKFICNIEDHLKCYLKETHVKEIVDYLAQ